MTNITRLSRGPGSAGYGGGIIRYHPFIDGNKRLALMVMYVFLEINGYRLAASEVDAADRMLRLAANELYEGDLSRWIARAIGAT